MIGVAKSNFKERMKAHCKQFFKILDESTVIYFGEVLEECDDALLQDIYSALVFYEKPHYMGTGIEEYRFMTRRLVRITNLGENPCLPFWVDAYEQIQWKDCVDEVFYL